MNSNAIFREIGKALGPAAGREKRKRLKTVQVTGPRLTKGEKPFGSRPGTPHRRDLR